MVGESVELTSEELHLGPECSLVDLSDLKIKPLQTHVLLEFVDLIEEVRFDTPGSKKHGWLSLEYDDVDKICDKSSHQPLLHSAKRV